MGHKYRGGGRYGASVLSLSKVGGIVVTVVGETK